MPGRRRILALFSLLLGFWVLVGAPLFNRLMIQQELREALLVWLPLSGDLENYSPTGEPVPVTVHGDVVMTDDGAAFDGEGDFLALPTQPLDHRPFAISMWLKLEGYADTYGILEQLSSGGRGNHLHLQLRHKKPFLSYYAINTKSEHELSPAQGWTHLVVQYTGAESQIWIDGKLDTHNFTPPFVGTKGEFVIGKTKKWSNVPSSDWDGSIRDLRVYERALRPYEIHALARKPSEAPTASPAPGLEEKPVEKELAAEKS